MADLPLNPRQDRLDGQLSALAFAFSSSLAYVSYAAVEKGELVVRTTRDHLVPFLTLLRDDPRYRFEQLMDLCGVDYPQRPERFDVVYNLLSVTYNRRVRVIVTTDEQAPVPSVHQLWPCATWWERECYDLFGVLFSGQADLRRILTDNGFEGHPLRKDFPLSGFEQVRYDIERKQVVKEPVSLTQDFRDFDFVSPWEGMLTLPGDEKAHEVRQGMKRSS
ncbi:NADH-quinone oxidoreductase subunit C [Acetobacter sp. TBRC 12305]|uniref:NADH-quinone oxidoreductase subunit C n=1 Tax=Acetobacter garciniae TaxID=2817435 RepID=A0A939KRQ5_9PROT|nr:NADH-quinone oxidoreductase subunit C [Acetobacter garciniae]MBX0345756.1 NADH-quinone oxidoreductase subunit C [Acetobacter garciniae]